MGDAHATDEPREDDRSSLVILGSSAGGIDAVLTLVAGLASDFPTPVVVVQHLDPSRESHLADLLASRSNLPVRNVTERMDLAPGAIYVVPSRHDVEVTDHEIFVARSNEARSHPSIDRFMASAAQVYKESLIGVVLTGTGSDGSTGAQAIKAHGGTVIVQNPESARFPGMPSAVPRSAIDIVADLQAIPGLLDDLCRGEFGLSPAEDDGEMQAFLDSVRDETGLDFAEYKRPTIERRLQRRMVAAGVSSLRDYHRYIERNPEEMQRLVASFLIKVTRFFRDTELFDHLRDRVLPSLLQEARKRGELRIWSAGCATGEEAYSLAMLIRDLQEDEPDAVPVRIFATDVAPDAVDFARHGVFPEAALDALPEDMVERHFTRINGGYEVRKLVRGLVIFGEHDLSRRAPFPRIDLVLCRNVLIYFTPELQRRALQLFAFSLRSGGYLALGKAETVSPLPEFFALEQSRIKLFRRVGGDAPVPVGRIVESLAARSQGGSQHRSLSRGMRSSRELERQQMVPRQSAQVLDTMTVGIVTVARNYHVRSINVAARAMLNIHSAAIGEDLIHQVPSALALQLRASIDAAFRGEQTTSQERLDRDVVDDGGRDFVITCSPVGEGGDGEPAGAVVVEIVDATSTAREHRGLVQDRDAVRTERDELRERVEAAITEIRALRAADHAMAIEHGRLLAENEQLQLASEEAQAAAEEIETLNEEQQAANEELETLNEELQATIEELNTTNADLEARTIELETLAHTNEQQRNASEEERARLHAMLTSMNDAVLVLSESGDVVLTNPAWDRMLGDPATLVPESETGQRLPASVWSIRRVLKDDPFTLEFTLPAADGSRRWFEARAQPVPDDRERGGMVVVRDITDRSLRHLQERFLAVASHELRTPMTSLSGSLQLMTRRLERAPGDEALKRHLDRASDQFRRLELLIGELTDIVRLRGGKFELALAPVDLRTVAREAVELARDASGEIDLRLDIADDDVPVDADSMRLEQVVLNLMLNAFRHATGTDRVDVRVRRDGGVAVVEVQDYGPGIPEQELANIFTEFHQAQGADARMQGGLGLGLFIAREIVSAHSGIIDAHSVVGEGVTFVVRLPLRPDDPDAQTAARRHEEIQ